MLLDEILDEKYEVYLLEADYRWNEYDDYTNNKPKLLATFKTQEEADAYLTLCEVHRAEVQKKYRGKIRYYITPKYLRHEVHAVWCFTKEPQEVLDKKFDWLFGKPDPKVPYTG